MVATLVSCILYDPVTKSTSPHMLKTSHSGFMCAYIDFNIDLFSLCTVGFFGQLGLLNCDDIFLGIFFVSLKG